MPDNERSWSRERPVGVRVWRNHMYHDERRRVGLYPHELPHTPDGHYGFSDSWWIEALPTDAIDGSNLPPLPTEEPMTTQTKPQDTRTPYRLASDAHNTLSRSVVANDQISLKVLSPQTISILVRGLGMNVSPAEAAALRDCLCHLLGPEGSRP